MSLIVSVCVFSIFEQLERAYQYELWAFVTMIGVATFLYSISGYLKAVILAFRLKGPKAMFIIGNTLMIGSKDREYFTQNIFYFFFFIVYIRRVCDVCGGHLVFCSERPDLVCCLRLP